MSIHDRIKQRRKDLGLSADEVADMLQVSRATIYRYESADISNMGIDKLVPLAQALQTTPAFLMEWTDDPYDYDSDPDGRFDNIPRSIFEVLMEKNRDDLEGVWHDWENMENANLLEAQLEQLQMHNLVISTIDPQINSIVTNAQKLNAQGLERLEQYSDDLVSSGKYQKEPLRPEKENSEKRK
ncbi:MAG: helix-turn-helix domain-containing protein [Clostridiales bacterium]|nr:helix-turn-helix domain-containing protein [Clostridiales bacterium]